MLSTQPQACMEVAQRLRVPPARMARYAVGLRPFAGQCRCVTALQASWQCHVSQVHDLQEALNEKELELMELKQQHAQLQVLSNSHALHREWQLAAVLFHFMVAMYVGFIDFLFAP